MFESTLQKSKFDEKTLMIFNIDNDHFVEYLKFKSGNTFII